MFVYLYRMLLFNLFNNEFNDTFKIFTGWASQICGLKLSQALSL